MQGNVTVMREAVKRYRAYLTTRGIPEESYFGDKFPQTEREVLSHCHSMLSEVDEYLKNDKLVRAAVCLGFVRGCLWSLTAYTLNEFISHLEPVSQAEI